MVGFMSVVDLAALEVADLKFLDQYSDTEANAVCVASRPYSSSIFIAGLGILIDGPVKTFF